MASPRRSLHACLDGALVPESLIGYDRPAVERVPREVWDVVEHV
jgi:hypothetical protein